MGWRARRHTDLIDLARVDHYRPEDFWEPVGADAAATLILNPGDFYILASKEAVVVPPDHAAEMRPYDTRVGEFRVHYAGFFDPGFGYAGSGGAGSRAVLEIRSFEVPFALRDGQLVGRLVYERLAAVPDKLYGAAIGSSYQRQGLMLAQAVPADELTRKEFRLNHRDGKGNGSSKDKNATGMPSIPSFKIFGSKCCYTSTN